MKMFSSQIYVSFMPRYLALNLLFYFILLIDNEVQFYFLYKISTKNLTWSTNYNQFYVYL